MIETIICLVRWAVHAIGQTLLTVLDFVLSALIVVVNLLVSVLPNDPTEMPDGAPTGALGFVNFFIPISAIMAQFGVLMTAWIVYRIYVVLLRWAKAEG